MSQPQDVAEQNIQMWKVKKLIKSLDAARGSVHRRYCLVVSCFLILVFLQSRNLYDQSHHPSKGVTGKMYDPCQSLTTGIPIFYFQDQISRVSAMLTQEYGTASNIKSRVNRLSVLAAITSTQQRLKLYNRVPPNGLVLFVGTILTDEGKEKKVSFDFEPHKPINT